MTNTEKITQAEMAQMFGEVMPIEAVSLLFNAGSEKTVGEIRSELRLLAGPPARWKAREIVYNLCEDPEMWATHGCPPFHKLQRLEDEFTAAIESAQNT